ncbi:Hsp33 family molecular chaperone HslO, partial [Paenibacillus sp. EKM208P]
YLVQSEQIPSSVGAGVIVNPDNSIQAAGGFIIQLMPDTQEEVISFIERRIESIPSISAMVMEGLTPEQILGQILGESNLNILETMPVQFHCPCSE